MKTTVKTGFVLLTVFLLSSFFLTQSCEVMGEKGNGKVAKQERKVSNFTGIDIGGAFDVYLTQGATQSVFIEADDNLLDNIRTEVEGDVLKVYTEDPIRNPKTLKVYITTTGLKSIELSGAVDLETQNKLTGSTMDLRLTGASDSKIEIEVSKLDMNSSGGTNIVLRGKATEVKMDLSGATELHAFELAAEKYSLDISGAGDAEISVKDELNANISGAANLHYRGTPTKIIEDVSGAGSIKKVL